MARNHPQILSATETNWKLCRWGWSSYHPAGLNWLMCDGSVHFLPKTIDMNVLGDLSTVAGGEPTQVPK